MTARMAWAAASACTVPPDEGGWRRPATEDPWRARRYRRNLLTCRKALSEIFDSMRRPQDAEGELRDSIHQARALVHDSPDDPACRAILSDALRTHALWLANQNRLAEAHSSIQEAVAQLDAAAKRTALDPQMVHQRASTHSSLAFVLLLRKDYDGAEYEAKLAMDICAKMPPGLARRVAGRDVLGNALNVLANVSMRRSDFPIAVDYCSRQIELDPVSVCAVQNRAVSYYNLQQYDKAIADAAKGLQLDPKNPVMHQIRARANWHQRQYTQAVGDFSKAIQLDAAGAMDYACRGKCLLQMGKYREALADLQHVLQLDPTDTFSNTLMAWLLASGPDELQDLQKARQIVDWAVLSPSDRSRILGAICYRLHRYSQAIALLSPYVEATDIQDAPMQWSGESLYFLAMACRQLGQYQQARDWLTRAEAQFRQYTGPEDIHLQSIRREGVDLMARVDALIVEPQDNGRLDLDPAGRQVLAVHSPSELAIRIDWLEQLESAETMLACTIVNHNDRQLQAGVDYDLQYDQQRQVLSIRPTSGQLADGTYRVSLGSSAAADDPSGCELSVTISTGPAAPCHLAFHSGRDGYASAKVDVQQAIEWIPEGSTWRYLDDNSDPGLAWREPKYDDRRWKAGPAQLGYGDGDEATRIDYGPSAQSKYATTYFRHAFQTPADPLRVYPLRLALLCDDGAAVYLNGKEILRYSLPVQAMHGTYTLAPVPDSSESLYGIHSVDPVQLRTGANWLAVEVHQSDPASSDVSFDVRLSTPPHAAIRFDDLFGDGPRQIPRGAQVLHAWVSLGEHDSGPADVRPVPMPGPEQTALAELCDTQEAPWLQGPNGQMAFDVTRSVQAWCDGQPNRGWLLITDDELYGWDGLEEHLELRVTYVRQ